VHFILALLFSQLFGLSEESIAASFVPQFAPCDPVTEILKPSKVGEPSPQFCAKWNPEFFHNGRTCCGKTPLGSRKRRTNRCSSGRAKASYCTDMTPLQKEYVQSISDGKNKDVLELLIQEIGRRGEQSHCSTMNGFLSYGRPVVPSILNRIHVQSPEKCFNFGTDAMAAMLEWLGREVSTTYSSPNHSEVRLILGDISAPRGGCLANPSGRRRHASHTTGQDADVGFLTVHSNRPSPIRFHRNFDLKTNWWFLKKIFKNPFACIKVVFLDRKHISMLSKFAHSDADWKLYSRFIRHMPGHKNHLHIRIGNGPGQAGCSPDARPELEFEDDDMEANELFILDELKTRQSSTIEE
jgi:murein endopeptidase